MHTSCGLLVAFLDRGKRDGVIIFVVIVAFKVRRAHATLIRSLSHTPLLALTAN